MVTMANVLTDYKRTGFDSQQFFKLFAVITAVLKQNKTIPYEAALYKISFDESVTLHYKMPSLSIHYEFYPSIVLNLEDEKSEIISYQIISTEEYTEFMTIKNPGDPIANAVESGDKSVLRLHSWLENKIKEKFIRKKV